MLRTLTLLIGMVPLLMNLSPAAGAEKRPGAYITSPREGASVGRISELTGKTFLRGQPLALVRAIDDNGDWWVQRTIQRNDRGQLQGTLQFGNEFAEPGTRFEFVVVVVQTPLELEFFTKRESLTELPASVPKSEIRSVVCGEPIADDLADDKAIDDLPRDQQPTEDPLGETNAATAQTFADIFSASPAGAAPLPGVAPLASAPGTGTAPADKAASDPLNQPRTEVPTEPAPTPHADGTLSTDNKGKPTRLGLAILKPLDDAKVQRFEELIGRMETEDAPVVLVRSEGDSQWWVQDQVVFGEGMYFKAKLHFGNGTTPSGTRFMVLVVSPQPGPETDALRPGTAFSELPRGIRHSKQVIVQLGPPAGAN